jgi:diguanylate cyclase (GGDEF)-like protein/PAS domain S-box-containing protein
MINSKAGSRPATKRKGGGAVTRQLKHRNASALRSRSKVDLDEVREALLASRAQYRRLFEDAVLGIFRSTLDGKVIDVNQAFAHMFRYESPEDVKATVRNVARQLFVDPEQRTEIMRLVLKQRVSRGFEVQYRRKDGTAFTGQLHVWAVRGSQGQVLWLEGFIEDITDRKHVEEQLRYVSTHDILTGLYNRAYFEEEMERLGRGRQYPITIVMADLNHLKVANDHAGHAAGDDLLRRAAELLREVLRSEDVIARIGGDEFTALLPETDAGAARRIVRRIRRHIAAHNAGHAGLPVDLALGCATAKKGGNVIRRSQAGGYGHV